MPITSWSYFTPYHEDPEVALQDLRRRVFRSREYGAPACAEPSHHGEETFDSIDELLEACGLDGTRSILDIRHVSDHPGLAVACAVPPQLVAAVYGSAEPSRAEVEAVPHGLEDAMELTSWEAVYVVVWARGRPSEIYFEGCSGD